MAKPVRKDQDSSQSSKKNEVKLKLGFGKPIPTKCVWVSGLSEDINEKDLHKEFSKFGGNVQDVLLNAAAGNALIYFDQVGLVQILWG